MSYIVWYLGFSFLLGMPFTVAYGAALANVNVNRLTSAIMSAVLGMITVNVIGMLFGVIPPFMVTIPLPF